LVNEIEAEKSKVEQARAEHNRYDVLALVVVYYIEGSNCRNSMETRPTSDRSTDIFARMSDQQIDPLAL